MKRIFIILALCAGITITEAENALTGQFTINAGGDQVVFAKGNLQYQASSDSWRFAEHQYDFVGDDEYGTVYIGSTKCNGEKAKADYSGWIELFPWGSSNWDNPNGVNGKEPWVRYSSQEDHYAGGDANNDLTGDYADADWAWHNAIEGDEAHTWRTMTYDEWNYVFTRNDTTLCGQARIEIGYYNYVRGLVLLPDNWEEVKPEGLAFYVGARLNYSKNKLTLEQWEQMATAGAVFLPITGNRQSGVDFFVANCEPSSAIGNYWTTTHKDEKDAWLFNFGDGQASKHPARMTAGHRYWGYAVRPVKAAAEAPTDVEMTDEQIPVSRKQLREGVILIEHNGRKYSVTGQKIESLEGTQR